MFIAGQAQFGVMRFMPYSAGVIFGIQDVGANLFVFFVAVATACALSAGFVLCAVTVFLPDTEQMKQCAYAILLTPLIQFCFFIYLLSFVALLSSIIFTGLGTTVPSEYLPVYYVMGFAGVAWFASRLFSALRWKRTFEAEETVKLREQTQEEVKEGENNNEARRRDDEIKAILTRINTSGSMSTFAGGYLYYNVATMVSNVMLQQTIKNSCCFML